MKFSAKFCVNFHILDFILDFYFHFISKSGHCYSNANMHNYKGNEELNKKQKYILNGPQVCVEWFDSFLGI
jgi:hypothetical protein